jgi:dihydroflavonol-4-reductase
MKKVLVTGANGFLGSWLCKRLLAEGHQVSALVRNGSDLSELDGVKVQYVYGDVTNLQSLMDSFKGHETVFHLAGLIAYKASQRFAMEKVNVVGTQNVLQACQSLGVYDLIYASSVVAVGAGFSKAEVLNEDSPYNVGHLNLGYFETKHQAEQMILKAAQSKLVQAKIFNPSTIYGPGDAKKGSRKSQLKVAQGRMPFFTSGGVNVVAIEDVLDGILAVWQKGQTGRRYILCGDNMTIQQLFQNIAMAAGVAAPKHKIPNWLLHGLGKIGDIASSLGAEGGISSENAWTASLYHWFSNERAKSELGFKARPSQLAIEASVKWSKDHGLI